MNSLSSHLFRAAALALALPVFGMCAAVQINGVCVDGNCVTPNPITYGTDESGSTSNGVKVNTDPFQVNTSFYVNSGSGTQIGFFPVVSYTGSTPSVGTSDTITVDLLASITDPGATSWDGKYDENIPLIIAKGSTASGELFADGQGLGLVGPYGQGSYDVYNTKTLVGLSGDTLHYDFQFVFTFDQGTLTGATDSSPSAPEPAQMIPAALSLAGFALVALRRRKQ